MRWLRLANRVIQQLSYSAAPRSSEYRSREPPCGHALVGCRNLRFGETPSQAKTFGRWIRSEDDGFRALSSGDITALQQRQFTRLLDPTMRIRDIGVQRQYEGYIHVVFLRVIRPNLIALATRGIKAQLEPESANATSPLLTISPSWSGCQWNGSPAADEYPRNRASDWNHDCIIIRARNTVDNKTANQRLTNILAMEQVATIGTASASVRIELVNAMLDAAALWYGGTTVYVVNDRIGQDRKVNAIDKADFVIRRGPRWLYGRERPHGSKRGR